MSINPSEPPPGVQYVPQTPRNPKAEAKADKAYAKAMRPWWKKKRFIIPLGLVVLTMVASAGSSGGEDGSASNGNASTGAASTGSGNSGSGNSGTGSASSGNASNGKANSGSAANSDDGKSGNVGQALTNAGTTYRVTNVRTTDTIGDPDLLGARADGTFIVVGLEMTNNKDETKTFTEASAKIETSDGKAYETSSKAVFAFGDDSLLLKDIQPDLTTRGKLAFDLPVSKLTGSTLVIEDLFGSGDIKVDLGL